MGAGGVSRRRVSAAIAAVVVVAGGFALYWFAPWNLVVDRTVDEALPSATAPTDEGASTPTASTGDDTATADPDEDASVTTLSRGRFASLEHETRGTALVVELADGSRFVRLEDLDTSNGPDLRVMLSSVEPQEDWYVYDDGALLDLGALKGNVGSSNYEIPDDVDPSEFRSIVVWCRRFSVGFGVAPVEIAPA